MSSFGFVIIARNEGERLRRCIGSVEGRGPVVYVDSGSTDGSVEWARQRPGVEIVELDMASPFTAARARNAGFRRLVEIAPDVELVQFVDGDCEVDPGWPDHAAAALAQHPEAAAVGGRLVERHPEASIYNRICQVEWDRPAGEVSHCGGIFVVRRTAFEKSGGFDPSIRAGEEPELCHRMRAQGWTIRRINDDMATHDAAMLRLSQWWTRQARGAYGALDLMTRFGLSGYRRQVMSALVWTVGWLGALAVTSVIAALLPSWITGLLATAVALAPLAMVARIALRLMLAGRSVTLALATAALTMLGKWPQLLGIYRYTRDSRRGLTARAFDYKTSA